ncbi:hypothetical protein M406DRAFT_333300 [Cryphonectria parasitica EP155]|uniref:Uncharacterized protein n=1 Tax=Cryphonectria parasitica (strain ATCC 38755 / EP155) TaxID=660469 RepID=A0A9P4XY70_CRYP1|nr:uncharacterized protein M406DRAFT_333300 [Cryphonectria parasitica EP155]KAF3762957.1 hypothetical protein M406DRAFT_333300 [Cryphonectria parasitica EP155]
MQVRPGTDSATSPVLVSEKFVSSTGESLEKKRSLIAPTLETISTSQTKPGADEQTYTTGRCESKSFKESVGLGSLISLVGGSLGILGVLGFIIFLWFGYGQAPEATKATWIWRQLAIRGWMSRAITLAALVLQLIIDTQVAVCTSMIAALLLERCSGSLIANAPTYPVFGEVATGYEASPDAYGFSDTGLKQRGLLPLVGSQNRTSVRQYSGNAMVLNSRAACMRPALVSSQYSTTAYEGSFGGLDGMLNYSQAIARGASRSQHILSLLRGLRANTVPLHSVGDNETDQWSSLESEGALPPGQPLENTEWLSYEILPRYFINISMCFTSFNIEHRQVQMVAQGSTREPSAHWSLMYDAGNTDDIQLYIGADGERQEISDRQILELQLPDYSNSNSTAIGLPPPLNDLLELPTDEIPPGDLTAGSIQLEMEYEFSGGNTPNTTFVVCNWCTKDGQPAHPEYALLFTGILASSPGGGRPADALDAFLSIGGFSAYNQFLLDSMDISENVTMVTTFAAMTPGPCSSVGMCGGFVSVITLLVVYLALVGIIVAIFIGNTRLSRCGNVWNTISQLVAFEELGQILDLGNDAGDKSIARAVQNAKPSRDILVKLGRNSQSGCNKAEPESLSAY